MTEDKKRNPLAKLGDALKPSHVIQHFKHSSNDHSEPNGDAHSQPTSNDSDSRLEEKRSKEDRQQAEKDEIEHHRAKLDEKAVREDSPEMRENYGDLDIPGEIIPLGEVVKMGEGKEVTFRARIHVQRAVSSQLDFIVFRQRGVMIQGVLNDDSSEHMIKWVERLPNETIVQVTGTLRQPPKALKASLDTPLEIHVEAIHLVEKSHEVPFNLSGATTPPQGIRLGNRILDLRHPSNQAIMRVRARVLKVFRDVLEGKEFMEIQTPKLQPAATESGAEVFKVAYFGRQAFLAQSPQLAKQMAISADFGRVYEIGPVFRAENSNTHRHLTEYTGLDLEMTIQQDYHEVMQTIDDVLKSVFAALKSMDQQISRIREEWPSDDFLLLDKTPVIPFTEAVRMLRDDGRDTEEEDLSTPDEIRLGELMREKYKSDYYIIDKFPLSARPFYTVSEDGKTSNSFDVFVRGQEVCTGGQRINDPKKLRESMRASGIDERTMKEYLTAFDWGVPPHGGGGLGLERIVTFFLDLPDVRLASLFHRDPQSLPEQGPSLPHPDADTLHIRDLEHPPPLENLIANYGDASNTSWLDDRFKIWRDELTGAAVGYVEQGKFCMITGDVLCDPSQKGGVTKRFLEYVDKSLKLKPVWMLVSEEQQDVLSQELNWRSFSCTVEQRAQSSEAAKADSKSNKEQKGVFKVKEVSPDEEFIKACDKRINDWKETRSGKGKQVHLTEIAPWKDMEHRQYFIAESSSSSDKNTSDSQSTIHTMVVLARLSPEHGYQVKWALDFPDSPNGAIEATVQNALASIPDSPVTFGAGVSEDFIAKAHMGKTRAKMMSRTYKGIVKSFGLDKKAGFREKFGVKGEEVYICFPKGGLKANEWGEVVKFFEE